MSLSLVIIILTGLISFKAFDDPVLKANLMFRPVNIRNGEYYRFFTSGLIHADFNHLFFNMFALYIFGGLVEDLFYIRLFGELWGRVAFILFYFSAVALASLPSYFRHQDNYAYSALGASGATSALLFIFVMYLPWHWFIFPPLPGILIGVGYLWYSSYMDKRGVDNIGHNAHLWGAIYGIVFIIVASLIFDRSLLMEMIAAFLRGPSMPVW